MHTSADVRDLDKILIGVLYPIYKPLIFIGSKKTP